MSRHISHGQFPSTQEDFNLESMKPETAVWIGCQCAHGTKGCHINASSTVPKGRLRSAKKSLDLSFELPLDQKYGSALEREKVRKSSALLEILDNPREGGCSANIS